MEETGQNLLYNRRVCTSRPKHPKEREAARRPLPRLECRSEKDLPTIQLHSCTDSVGSYWTGDELPCEKACDSGIRREGTTNTGAENADKGPRWIDEGHEISDDTEVEVKLLVVGMYILVTGCDYVHIHFVDVTLIT